jgi:glutaredoxin
MSRAFRIRLACGVAAGVIAVAAAAQSPHSIYRYVDANGNVGYTDKAPPANAKSVEPKRLTPNFIETDEVAMAAAKARDRYPVTLYTFACGDVCDRAEALLNRRGVPYAVVNVSDPEGQDKLQKLTGELRAPVLQAGDTLVFKGFGETEWQDLLDKAGYPKEPRTARRTTVAPPRAAPAQKGRAEPTTAAPAAGGYPTN